MDNAPMIAWDYFTGIARFRTEHINVDCVVYEGIIRRTIPCLKRFTGKPLRTAFDWYNRHPDLSCSFDHRDVIDTVGPSPWRHTPPTR